MPSFAKPANNNDTKSNTLEDVWKDNSATAAVNDLLSESRTRAATILRETIPAKLVHLRELLKGQDDPNSPLWTGHVLQGAYVAPQMIFPGSGASLHANGESGGTAVAIDSTDKVYLPSDVGAVFGQPGIRGAAAAAAAVGQSTAPGSDDDHGCVGNGTEDKVRMGMHWFEVVPENKIQRDLIQLAVVEFEELYDLVIDLKLWLEMEVPVIEDGNSFGAEVQSHLIGQLEATLKKAIGWQNGSRQHFSDRYKLIEEWVKYPNVKCSHTPDIPAAIASSDRFDHYLVRSYLRSLLIAYAGLMTKFERNWLKVINPKGKDGGSIGGMY